MLLKIRATSSRKGHFGPLAGQDSSEQWELTIEYYITYPLQSVLVKHITTGRLEELVLTAASSRVPGADIPLYASHPVSVPQLSLHPRLDFPLSKHSRSSNLETVMLLSSP